MQTSIEINEGMLSNESEFDDPFFNQFKLTPMKSPLELTDKIKKQYVFPTFYTNVSCSMGIFFCNYKSAKKILPDSSMYPVDMLMGRTLVIFSCYQYRSVYNIKPYNEIAMTIPIQVGKGIRVPILPVIVPVFKNFGYYVFGMPVTSKENQIRGNKIWGLPKVTHQIDIYDEDGKEVTEARAEDGEIYFKLKIPKHGKTENVSSKANLYSKLNGTLLKSTTQFEGRFETKKFIKRLFESPAKISDDSILKIGKTSAAETLNALEIDPRPFQFRYTNKMRSVFDLPNTF